MVRNVSAIQTGVAQDAVNSPHVKEQARKGLIEFLREQVVEAEWKITRAKAEIAAYNAAIKAIQRSDTAVKKTPKC